MLFERIATLTPSGILHNQYIETRGAYITYIGTNPPPSYRGETYPGEGRLLLPAFYSAHGHTPMTLLRGYGEGLTLHDWLFTRVFPFEARMTPEDIYWATLLGAAEMARYGLVSVSDMYCKLDQMARAFHESGLKVNLCNGTTSSGDTPYEKLNSTIETHRALADWHGADDGRIQIELGLHAEYTTDEGIVRAVAEDAARLNARVQVHLSETLSEHEGCKARRGGRTPTRYLDDCGLFAQPTTAAHGVHLEAGDWEILSARGVTLATCPKSNLKLASGVFNAPKAMQAGVNIALGTDSVASNNSLNPIEEMRALLLLQNGLWGDPTALGAAQAFAIASRNGALSQGRDDCGHIKEGFRADLCVLDVTGAGMHPVHDLLQSAAYSASGSDIVLTMCDGRVVYRDGAFPTIDVARAKAECGKAAARIAGES
ncbi:MAG: amidohydrolase [Oscillospiraceae bacterium]|jgi:5-methylthioadenosine/S-adenosylhomocysteine deaminase|nr:amidohydrolase [Oscillospiraceae bacterium]